MYIFIAGDELRDCTKRRWVFLIHWGSYLVVFDNVLISALFNFMRVVWHFTCFVWNYVYVTAMYVYITVMTMKGLIYVGKSSLPMVRIIINGKVVATHDKDINICWKVVATNDMGIEWKSPLPMVNILIYVGKLSLSTAWESCRYPW
jgi:hypothetical protein